MSKQTPPTFFAWLDTRLHDLDLTDYALAKKAGIAHSVISKARTDVQGIGWDAGVAIAQALDLPPEVILRRLELLPLSGQDKQRSVLVDEMLHVFPDLSEPDQEEVLQISRLKLERRKRETRGKKPGA